MTRKKIFWLLKLIITIFILVILVNIIKPDEILNALKNARRGPVLFALALLPVNMALQVIKWHILLRTLKQESSLYEAISSILVGFTLGLATPGRLGELARAFAVKDRNPVQIIGLSLADKCYNLACIALFGGLGILTLPGMVLEQNLFLQISSSILYLIGALIVVYLALHPGFIRGILYSISLMLPKRDKIKALITSLDGITTANARTVFIISILFYFTFIMQFFALTNAFDNLAFLDGIRGLPVIIFTKTFLPISIGGLGVGELAAVRFLNLFRVQAAAAFNASLILFTFNVLAPGLIGLVFIPKLRFSEGNK
jgi:uncharacterized protein (TIRG00374 family)